MVTVYEALNWDEVEKLNESLKGWTDYVPLELIPYTDDDYFQKCTKEASRKYNETRQGIGTKGNSLDEYFLIDILEWVNEYPQFQNIINWEKINK